MVGLLFQIVGQVSDTERLLTGKDFTLAGVLIVGIVVVAVGFLREWVVTGAQYRRLQADRDRWMNLAWSAANTARSGVATAHEAARTLRVITENGVPPAGIEQPQQQGMEPYGGPG